MTEYNLTAPPPNPTRNHIIKSWPEFFAAAWAGTKTFEIRLDDRSYAVGDTIDMHEFDPKTRRFTGRVLHRRVVYITNYLQRDNYIVMQLAP